MCPRGLIEVSERELNGTCNSTCTYKSYFGPPKQGCTRIDNCKKKETGWKRFFSQCVPCICDCALSCGELPPHRAVKPKWWTCRNVVSVQILLNVVNYCFKHEFAVFPWGIPCKEHICLFIFSVCRVKHGENAMLTLQWEIRWRNNTQTACTPQSHTMFMLLHPIFISQWTKIWMF